MEEQLREQEARVDKAKIDKMYKQYNKLMNK